MGIFNEYIKSVLTVGICAFLCELICTFSRKSNTMSKAVQLTLNLCVFTITVLPFFSFMNKFEYSKTEIPESETIQDTDITLAKLTADEFEKLLKSQIYKNAGIEIKNIEVELDTVENDFIIKKVSVNLADEVDTESIKNCLIEILGENITTEIKVNQNEQN